MSRPKLFDGAPTRTVDVALPEDLIDVLRAVAKRHALTPAAYLRSLAVTHLNKVAASKATCNE